MFQNDTLRGKQILITGGGSGLGRAMALRFAGLGADVAICGRSEATLEQTLSELKQLPIRAAAVAGDVRDFNAMERVFERSIEALGGLSCLVNNAAGNFYCPSEDLSPNAFATVLDIVLKGSFHCSKLFGSHLIERQTPGSILNIVTTYTETGSAFVLPSACAKAGVYAMTTTLAYEWAEYGIRVNAIAPGPFPTEGAWSRLIPDPSFEQQYLARHPMHRFGAPEELANLAAFLLSDLAPYINGECIAIDGGERLQGGQFNFLAQAFPRPELKQLFQRLRPRSGPGDDAKE